MKIIIDPYSKKECEIAKFLDAAFRNFTPVQVTHKKLKIKMVVTHEKINTQINIENIEFNLEDMEK